MSKIIIIFLCLFSFLISGQNLISEQNLALAAAKNEAKIKASLAKVQQYYANLQTLQADFKQILTHCESGRVEERKGKLSFATPLLIRWETLSPNPELLLVGKKEVWNYLPDEQVAWKLPLTILADAASIVRVLTGQIVIDREFITQDAGIKNNLQQLRLFPKEASPNFVEALIAIDQAGRITQVEVIDFYGNSNAVHLSSLKQNQKIADSVFQFVPPDDVDVEEHNELPSLF